MAVVIQPKYPIPNRSEHGPHSEAEDEGIKEIAWCEGVLSDGRAFRAEMWAEGGISMLTFFFSSADLGHLDQNQICNLIEREGLVVFKGADPRLCEASLFEDDAGNPAWSVNVVVGDEDQSYLAHSVSVFPYSSVGEPDTVFSTTPIKAAHRLNVSLNRK